MSFLNSMISPLSITFAVIVLGYCLGRIKVFGVSLDLAGVLIVAVAIGWLLAVVVNVKEYINALDFQTNMKFFSSFGTALFVSVIGIATGYSLDIKRWKDIKAALIGSLMVLSAFFTMKIISVIDAEISISKLLGTLCGALTTTPGLSAACEIKSISAEEAMLGYGCAYLFGVVFTVMFVQIITRHCIELTNEKEHYDKNISSIAAFDGVIQLGFAIFIGRLIGSIQIFDFSLGNSGGMLCSGIVIGLIIKKWLPERTAPQKSLSLLRNFGLALFFVGNGIPAGVQLGYGFEIRAVLYGTIMTIIPIFVGSTLCVFLFEKERKLIATIIAGGMTSTPAIGMLMQKYQNINMLRYSLAYSGALVTIVLLFRSSLVNA